MNVANLDQNLREELEALSGWKLPEHDILSYLLSKLPRTLYDNRVVLTIEPATDETWNAGYTQIAENGKQFGKEADTPENAACALAIKLFQQNILQRSSEKQ